MRVTFPNFLLRQEIIPRAVGMSLEPQRSISGAETVTPTFGGRWEVTCSFVLKNEASYLAWQAFRAQMEGRIGTTLVPIATRFRPKDRDGHSAHGSRSAGIVGAQTWEHFGFLASPVVTMTLAEPAALRATTIKASLGNTTGIRPGQYFSIDERLHQVQHHWENGDGTVNLMIWPPLRRSFATAGWSLIMDHPHCLMRMASENEGEFDHLLDRLPQVTVSFVEAEI